MNKLEKLDLQKMIKANDVVDCTEDIRTKKHSQRIRDDVTKMIDLKKKYARLSKSNPEQFDKMCVSQCNFIFTNYTDIYNKIKKDEINLDTLWQLLNVLKRIEEGDIDQHTGAFEVGKLLKSIYIDGALMKAEKIDKSTGKKIASKPNIVKKMTWKQYKTMDCEIGDVD